jgi:uncharacterized protein YkwD
VELLPFSKPMELEFFRLRVSVGVRNLPVRVETGFIVCTEVTVRGGMRSAAAALVGIMLCWAAYGQTSVSREERELFSSVNQARRTQGLHPLRWDESLAAAALGHAKVMAERGSAQHSFAGEPGLPERVKEAGARFRWLSENVTEGPTPRFIHAQLMESARHRANILDRDMDSIGIGVVERHGQLFVVEDISEAR